MSKEDILHFQNIVLDIILFSSLVLNSVYLLEHVVMIVLKMLILYNM